ncbi:hypothetical protein RYH73_15755 [Olivibacter sp. CPCC 100613]|uniref:hypothetical protein n=1 Tax=Olivibacter sp. CPCC 100613 TaxID=3079931 RepID=UPI002FFD003A
MNKNNTHNNLFIKLLYIIILFFYSQYAFAQVFDDYQNPPSVKWREIQTPDFQIIFPSEFEEQAQHLTFVLESILSKVSHSIGKKPRKISIILQNRDVVSNGFVQLAPRRSEFATTPPQQMDYQDWLNSLAMHELRHVVQFDKIAGYLKAPLFEQLALAIFGITLPPWFYEGDAVGIETVLGTAGRGRLPSWELPFRTNTLSGKRYSYQKDFLGSLKQVTPGYYQLGYFMTTKMRRDYGENFLEQLMTRIAKNPIRPYNFSNSLKTFTGYNTKQWHKKTVDELDSLWHAQLTKTQALSYPTFPKKQSEVIDFLLPKPLPNGHVLALEKSNHSVPKIVRIMADGNIKEVIKTGIQTTPHFSYGGNKITWDELRYDKRYLKRSFHVINIYDLETKKYKQLTFKTRLFSPALSRDGKHIAAIEIDLKNSASLLLLNSATGKEERKIILPPNLNVQTPSFDSTGTKIITTALRQEGANLLEINLITGQSQLLLGWQKQQLERPIYTPHGILFKAHYNGIDNLYLLPYTSGQIQQLTNIKFGATNPAFDEMSETIYFNNYQVNGYLISKLDWQALLHQPIRSSQDHFIAYFKPLREQETATDTSTFIPTKTFASRPYKDLKHLFNFHSISPLGDDISSIDNFDLGLQLMSDNLTNTLSARIGFNYDQNTSRTDYFISTSFKRWFPKFTIEYRNRAQLSSLKLQNKPDERIPLRWREHYTELKASVPLTFNRLNTIYNTGVSVGTSYTWRYNISLKDVSLPNFNEVKFPLLIQYYFNRNSRRSLLDLAPKWGQNLNFIYRGLAFDRRLSGNIFSMKSTLYFPGIVNNHSLQLRFNFQERNGDYRFTNDIPMVSGYDQLPSTNVNNTLFIDYRFPLIYPDWELGPLAYIKRFKAGVFADFENVAQHTRFQPRTLGLELRADLNILRFYLPNFDAGIRAIYVNEPGSKNIIFTYGVSYTY